MKIQDFFLVVVLTLALLLGFFKYVKSDSSYRPPTKEELITSMRGDVMSDLARIMSQVNNLAKIEMVMQIPCAKVTVSSKTINGQLQYGLEANYGECKD